MIIHITALNNHAKNIMRMNVKDNRFNKASRMMVGYSENVISQTPFIIEVRIKRIPKSLNNMIITALSDTFLEKGLTSKDFIIEVKG